MNVQKVEISRKTIVFTVLFLIGLSLLWQLRSLMVMLFICLVFMGALNPSVQRLEKYKIPRPFGIILLYIIIVSFISFVVAGIIPILVEQTTNLINVLPSLLQETTFFGARAIDLSSQLRLLESLPANIARTTISLFSNVFSSFIIFVMTYYLLIDRHQFPQYGRLLYGQKGETATRQIVAGLETRLGSWVNAEVFLMAIIGLLSYLGYFILGLDYAVPLALIAGLLEVVPNIGPTISSLLAALVGLTVSPLTALFAFIWGVIVQQLENNFIVPKIMKETVGLNPLVTLLLLLAGAELGGVMGAVLAVPLYLTFEVVFKVILGLKDLKEIDKPNSV